MNELKSDSSTAIEDTLFILRKCMERSRGVQSDAPSAIIAEAQSALKSELLACLTRRSKVELRAPDNLYVGLACFPVELFCRLLPMIAWVR